MKYVVVSEYSGVTARKVLWEVHTRPMPELMATDFIDTLIAIDKKNKRRKKREYFVVAVKDKSGATGSPI